MQIEIKNAVVTLPVSDRQLFSIEHFTVPAGSKILIHGASGKGKTTLLHLMAGLLKPKTGCVKLGQHTLTDLSDDARAKVRREHVGFIFQKLNLIDHLTCEENVRLGHDVHNNAMHEALKKVGLYERRQELSVKLSLGEQQRVAVARVLASDASVILADEPTSSLDSHNADLVMDALLAAGTKSTLIVVSHDERLRKRFSKALHFEDLVNA